jgi:hypothetical protein
MTPVAIVALVVAPDTRASTNADVGPVVSATRLSPARRTASGRPVVGQRRPGRASIYRVISSPAVAEIVGEGRPAGREPPSHPRRYGGMVQQLAAADASHRRPAVGPVNDAQHRAGLATAPRDLSGSLSWSANASLIRRPARQRRPMSARSGWPSARSPIVGITATISSIVGGSAGDCSPLLRGGWPQW